MIVSLPSVKVASGSHDNALNPVHVRFVESESYSSSASPPRYLLSTSFFTRKRTGRTELCLQGFSHPLHIPRE